MFGGWLTESANAIPLIITSLVVIFGGLGVGLLIWDLAEREKQ